MALIGLIALLGVAVSLAWVTAAIANRKGYNYWVWFVFGMLLFIIATPIALILPKAKEPKQARPNGVKHAFLGLAWSHVFVLAAYAGSIDFGVQTTVMLGLGVLAMWWTLRSEPEAAVLSGMIGIEIKFIGGFVALAMLAMTFIGIPFAGVGAVILVAWYIKSVLSMLVEASSVTSEPVEIIAKEPVV